MHMCRLPVPPILCHDGKQEVNTVELLSILILIITMFTMIMIIITVMSNFFLFNIIIVTNSSWIGIILIAFMTMTVLIGVGSDCARPEVTVQ